MEPKHLDHETYMRRMAEGPQPDMVDHPPSRQPWVRGSNTYLLATASNTFGGSARKTTPSRTSRNAAGISTN